MQKNISYKNPSKIQFIKAKKSEKMKQYGLGKEARKITTQKILMRFCWK